MPITDRFGVLFLVDPLRPRRGQDLSHQPFTGEVGVAHWRLGGGNEVEGRRSAQAAGEQEQTVWVERSQALRRFTFPLVVLLYSCCVSLHHVVGQVR